MIKENLFRLKNGKYENQLFIQFLVLVTVPLLILGFITYYIYVKGEEQRSRTSLEAACRNLSQTYEHVFSSVRDYYLDVTTSREYQWLKTQEEIPYSSYSNLKDAMSRLQGNYYLRGYTEGYAYVNAEYGWVFSNNGMIAAEELTNKEVLEAYLEEEAQYPANVRFMNRLDEPAPDDSAIPVYRLMDLTGENLVLKETSLTGQIRHLLLIRLNVLRLKELSDGYRKPGYQVLILSDGKTLLETDPLFTEAVLQSGNGTEAGVLHGKYGRYQISSEEASALGLRFYLGYNMAAFQKNGQIFLVFTALFTLVMAVLLVVIRYIAIRFSEPVASLQRQVDVQNSRIQELFVTNMLKGGMSEEAIYRSLNRLEKTPFACYRMVGMMTKTQDGPQPELKGLSEDAKGWLPEEISSRLFLSPVVYKDILLFLVGAEDEYQLDEKTALLYKEIKDCLSEKTGQAVASGISRLFTSLTHLAQAREECFEALHNRQHLMDELSSMVLYDDYRTRYHGSNIYDIIVENELTNAIAAGNEEEARHLMTLGLERPARLGVIGLERSLYIVRLLTAVMSVPGGAGIPIGDVFTKEQNNIISQAGQIYNDRELSEYVDKEILTPVLRVMCARKQADSSDLAKRVIQLIRESKGSITLSECADLLSYHPNYIGKILKAEKGLTFTEIANEERLELAKYMLLTTDEPMAAISEKLGYNNVQNFIRFFKAHVGSTPAAFRREHKH